MVPSEGFEPPTGELEVHCSAFHIIHYDSPEPITAGSSVYHCFFGFIIYHSRTCHTEERVGVRSGGAFLYVRGECSVIDSHARG